MEPASSNEPPISPDDSHDLRNALVLTKGWLEVLFRRWDELPDNERSQCLAGALPGANQMTFLLAQMDGHTIDLTVNPEARMADEFLKLAEHDGKHPV